MSENVDLLKKGYADFGSGDIQAPTAPWSDGFTWEGPDSEELPGAGRHEGMDAALQVLHKAVGAWDEFNLSADEFIDGGDAVMVRGHNEASKGGNSIKQPVVHIWRFEGGRSGSSS